MTHSNHFQTGLVWLRRDLRLEDNRALFEAQKVCEEIYLIFVFDTTILNILKDPEDKRVSFIQQALINIEMELQKTGGGLQVFHGDPLEIIPKFFAQLNCSALFFNRDYEPNARLRDQNMSEHIRKIGGQTYSFQDHVIFEPETILKKDGKPYTVFTPYKKKWLNTFYAEGMPCLSYKTTLEKIKSGNCSNYLTPSGLTHLGFKQTNTIINPERKQALKRLNYFQQELLEDYDKKRDYPSIDGTSLLSSYLRFGLISIREVVQAAISKNSSGNQVWLSEIVWREFYQTILWHFPHVKALPFKARYSGIKWQGIPAHFEAWCRGQTGFPIVDAAMRCLNKTGLMPNRLRMVTASFLCKTLLLDWKPGEQYFAQKLLDFDLAANNGGWQWCASSGCDAQPYFRIFNPYTQSQKFDPNGDFIKEWCPELKELTGKTLHNPSLLKNKDIVIDYPQPIVDYSINRKRALDMYKIGINKG